MSIFSASVWGSACRPHHIGETGTQPALSNQKVLLALGKRERIAASLFPMDTAPLSEQLPLKFSSVQSLSRVRLFETPWTAALQASLPIT